MNDIQVYYEIQGEGPKLLFISGLGGDLRNRPNVFDSSLKDEFMVMSYDQRGQGQTDKPDTEYTMADYCDDAATLMDTHGWASAYVMGVSFGGSVAQELALRHQEKTEKLVLACSSSGGKGGTSYPLHELNSLPYEERARRSFDIVDSRCGEEWKRLHPEDYKKNIQEWVKWFEYVDSNPEIKNSINRLHDARENHDTYDRLHRLSLPVFICGGRYDHLAPPSNLEKMHQQIQDSRLNFYEGGHFFLNQDPEAFKQVIEFLKE